MNNNHLIYEQLKPRIINFKTDVLTALAMKYSLAPSECIRLVEEYDINKMLIGCDYSALYDNPEKWADRIYTLRCV